MPVSSDYGPDFRFARAVHFTGADRELIYWLIQESGIDSDVKERLSNKICGYFVSPRTELLSKKLLAARAAKAKRPSGGES